jgi:nucleoside 2-deoxyribosyltransferase
MPRGRRRQNRQPLKPLRVYLAGPDVFLAEALQIAEQKKRLCAQRGFAGVFPLDAKIARGAKRSPAATAYAIAAANEALIRGCDIVVANCSPFRGVSMDAGTAYEIGYARALGKPVFGYTNCVAGYKHRAERYRRLGDPLGADARGSMIEDFRLGENLMIAVAVCGHDLVRRRVKRGRELTDLAGFVRCLALAAMTMGAPRRGAPGAGQPCPARARSASE